MSSVTSAPNKRVERTGGDAAAPFTALADAAGRSPARYADLVEL